MASYDGALGGGCLPYSKSTNTKQPWLWDHMYRWKAEASSRTRAMPHIKTYTRVSPDQDKMAYFLLTSANLSKAAWGSMNKAGNSCLIMSYEAGVLFLPKFITGKNDIKPFLVQGTVKLFYMGTWGGGPPWIRLQVWHMAYSLRFSLFRFLWPIR